MAQLVSVHHNIDDARADLAGVKSSSQSSIPMQVSRVLTTASPNGTLIYHTNNVKKAGMYTIYTTERTCPVTA